MLKKQTVFLWEAGDCAESYGTQDDEDFEMIPTKEVLLIMRVMN